jgi:hypothetical protein
MLRPVVTNRMMRKVMEKHCPDAGESLGAGEWDAKPLYPNDSLPQDK